MSAQVIHLHLAAAEKFRRSVVKNAMEAPSRAIQEEHMRPLERLDELVAAYKREHGIVLPSVAVSLTATDDGV